VSTRRVAVFQRASTVLQVPKSMAMVMAPFPVCYCASIPISPLIYHTKQAWWTLGVR
jgi:hypothetical protein